MFLNRIYLRLESKYIYEKKVTFVKKKSHLKLQEYRRFTT